jgi:F-type H+-transporting ATPase subunit gamma
LSPKMLRPGIARLWMVSLPTATEQQRGFATLKDISIRLKSVKNIQKITKSMKMVSAAKYAKAERDLRGARVYGEGAQTFFDNLGTEQVAADNATTTPEIEGSKRLLILITSDRGLCGAVHTSIIKNAKNVLSKAQEGVEYKVACIGDKSKAGLQRLFAPYILFTANGIGRAPPTFEDASLTANAILNSGYDFDGGAIIYNRFKSVVSYETKLLPLLPIETIKRNEKLNLYDSVDDEVLQCYTEYALAQLIYYAMKESATSEQSSRMTAMDGASKNAGEMIDKLTMQFNRTRQAVITRELIEIISGAAAV